MNEDIQLWFCRLEAAEVPAGLLQDLPPDQALRISQMTRTDARQLRLLAWWLRNRLLAEELGVGMPDLEFGKDSCGKPVLQGQQAALHFSLSHTRACVAVACGFVPLGVDVEPRQRQADWGRVSERMFSTAERQALMTLAPARRPAMATALWSARESWSKATGSGVSGFSREPAFELVAGRWQSPAGSFWQYALPRHVLSLALPRGGEPPRCYELSLTGTGEARRLRREVAALDEYTSETE